MMLEIVAVLVGVLVIVLIGAALIGRLTYHRLVGRDGIYHLKPIRQHIGHLHSMKVIAPSENRVIRFGLGSPEHPTFFVWRLWTQGDEIYLGFTPKNSPKFSLHSSGNWQIDLGTLRKRLDGPIRCGNGWTMGPTVFFVNLPHADVSAMRDARDSAKSRRNVLWFDLPHEWHQSQFIVFIADAGLAPDTLPPHDAQVRFQHAIGPLRLRSGGRLWLRQTSKKWPDDRRDYILGLRRERPRLGPRSVHGMLMQLTTENRLVVIPWTKRGPEGTVLLDNQI